MEGATNNTSLSYFNPTTEFIGRTQGPTNGGYRVMNHSIKGNVAFLATANQGSYPGQGLKALDITDPSNPVEIGSYTDSTNYWDVIVEGNIGYLLYPDELIVLDVSDPTNMTKTSSVSLWGFSGRLAKLGNIIAVGKHTGFELIDVSDPSSPVSVGSQATSGASYFISFKNQDILYVPVTSLGAVAYDISDPSSISELNTISSTDSSSTTYEYRSLYVKNNTLVFNDGDSGIKLYDISNSSLPVYKSSLPNYSANNSPPYLVDNALFAGGYKNGNQSIKLYNISNLNSPTLFKEMEINDSDSVSASELSAISTIGNKLFLSSSMNSFAILKF